MTSYDRIMRDMEIEKILAGELHSPFSEIEKLHEKLLQRDHIIEGLRTELARLKSPPAQPATGLPSSTQSPLAAEPAARLDGGEPDFPSLTGEPTQPSNGR